MKMLKQTFFPQRPELHPAVYAYRDKNPEHAGLLKVGFTQHDVERRVAQQFPVIQPGGGKPYEIVFSESAMRPDGTSFMDHDVHKRLKQNGFSNVGGEWFRCGADDVRNAWLEVRDRRDYESQRTETFSMRPEQEQAVEKTQAYFESCLREGSHRKPTFLWNAKMRFGKTFATYELAKRMNMRRLLVLTFKPAVEDAWESDLKSHVDFDGWQFVARDVGLEYDSCDPKRPIVCFGSFQDYLGKSDTGGIKAKNEWVHLEDWDMVVFDEYHFGAWRDSAKNLFAKQDDDVVEDGRGKASTEGNELDETWLPISSRFYLYLSGTPFRALNSGEFIEEQIFNWTYTDEQRAKDNWVGADNPYETLPRMVLMTYKVPDAITRIALQGEFDEFDLNLFFAAEGTGADAHFKYEDYVQKWLDLIRGSGQQTTVDTLKQGAEKPPWPFSDARLLSTLTHTLWFLPSVSSCMAMENLLESRHNTFYHDYKVIVAAGAEAGMGVDAVEPVREAMGNPLATKTITLSCGKLTTGVTVKPWSGVLMLRNLKTPETYFQTAFRVQSPWTTKGEDGKTEILKRECYVFDFALDRALAMVSDYSCRLSVEETSPEKKVGEFVSFLPVLAYDGSAMREVNAAEILDIAMAGTSATLLARRWESALLVNVDNDTLRRLLASDEAIKALMSIEGFRSLNSDIETIINKSEAVKKAKKEGTAQTAKEKRELSAEEKEMKSKRKEIQEKLIKFATRIPVFMYLTDYREQCLKDVITQLEPGLFKKVTGLDVRDFELLVSLGVFNDGLMNDAVYKFRRYEDSSLSYTGIERHIYDQSVGLFDTALTREDYEVMKLQDMRLRSDGTARKPGEDVVLTSEVMTIDKDGAPHASQRRVDVIRMDEPVPVGRRNGGAKPAAAHGAAPAAKPAASTRPAASAKPQPVAPRPAAKSAPEPEAPKRPATPKPTKAELDSIGKGTVVYHKAFGKGTVRSVSEGKINVYVGGKERTFQFPATFEQGFLSLRGM